MSDIKHTTERERVNKVIIDTNPTSNFSIREYPEDGHFVIEHEGVIKLYGVDEGFMKKTLLAIRLYESMVQDTRADILEFKGRE